LFRSSTDFGKHLGNVPGELCGRSFKSKDRTLGTVSEIFSLASTTESWVNLEVVREILSKIGLSIMPIKVMDGNRNHLVTYQFSWTKVHQRLILRP
jgi:hypothetical protein